jgi:hypothetical protein
LIMILKGRNGKNINANVLQLCPVGQLIAQIFDNK